MNKTKIWRRREEIELRRRQLERQLNEIKREDKMLASMLEKDLETITIL